MKRKYVDKYQTSIELGSNGWPINLQIPPGQKQRWQICWSAGSSRTWSPPPPPRTTRTSSHLSSTRGVHNYHHQNRADYQGLMFLDLGSIDQIPNMDNLDNIQCTSLPMCHLIMAEYFQQQDSIAEFKNRFVLVFFVLFSLSQPTVLCSGVLRRISTIQRLFWNNHFFADWLQLSYPWKFPSTVQPPLLLWNLLRFSGASNPNWDPVELDGASNLLSLTHLLLTPFHCWSAIYRLRV